MLSSRDGLSLVPSCCFGGNLLLYLDPDSRVSPVHIGRCYRKKIRVLSEHDLALVCETEHAKEAVIQSLLNSVKLAFNDPVLNLEALLA